MTDEQEKESAETDGTPKVPRVKDQVPAHIPPQLRELFTKHPGSMAARPGFRNPANAKSKAQKNGAKDK